MFAKMKGMIEGKETYFLCTALAGGSLATYYILERFRCLQTTYLLSCVSFLLLVAALSFVLTRLHPPEGKNVVPNTVASTMAERSPILWTAIFFTLGIFCYSTRHIVLYSEIPHSPFPGVYSFIDKTIGNIPFEKQESNAIVRALILGNRSSLDKNIVSAFRLSGASHFLALSGMHLGIICIIIDRVLLIFGNSIISRKIRYVCIILATLFYVLVCGSGASLVRAWIFIFLGAMGHILDRRGTLQRIYSSSLIIHICLQSENVSDIGFQLSYLAMAGITFLWPAVKGWVDSGIWRAASLSICCQICTAPLTYLYFGTFPKYFLITNIIGGPLLTLVMLSSVWAVAAQMIHPFCSVSALICEIPINALCSLMGIISGMEQ